MEFNQSVSGKSFMCRRTTEPFKPTGVDLVACQHLVSLLNIPERSLLYFRIQLSRFLHKLQGKNIWECTRRHLFKTSMRFSQNGFCAIEQVTNQIREYIEPRLDGSFFCIANR